MSVGIAYDRAALEAFCSRWAIRELALFGSALRSDFRADSDVDVLVTFREPAQWGLIDLARMEHELERIFGRRVDLVDRRSVTRSRNWIRRKAILDSAVRLYAA